MIKQFGETESIQLTDKEEPKSKEDLYYNRRNKIALIDRTVKDEELMELRRSEIDEIKDNLASVNILIVGTTARSGSSSVLEKINDDVNSSGKNYSKMIPMVGIDQDYIKIKYELKPTIDKGGEAVLIIDEANHIFELTGPEYDRIEQEEEMINTIKKLVSSGVKIVLQVHDNYGENGEGGTVRMEEYLKEKIVTGTDLKIGNMQLETLDREDMGNLFDIYMDRFEASEFLRNKKEEAVNICTIPQQLSNILERLIESLRRGENEDEAWEFAKKSIMSRSLDDIIRTTGGEKLRLLLKKVAENDGISLADLSDDERVLYERYKKFNYFIEESSDNIVVNGEHLKKYVLGDIY